MLRLIAAGLTVLAALAVVERPAEACCVGCPCTKYKDRGKQRILAEQVLGYTHSVVGGIPPWSYARIARFLARGTWQPITPRSLPTGAQVVDQDTVVIEAPSIQFITADKAGTKTRGAAVLIRRIEKQGSAILVEVDDRTFKLAPCPRKRATTCLVDPGNLTLAPVAPPDDPPDPTGGFAKPPTPSPPPPPPRPNPTTSCRADARHCCLPDGRLVEPGGCQPSYPDNVEPATRRSPDGRCVRIECHLKCLPANALIATPFGPVPVSTLSVGALVWTATAAGARVAAPLVAIESIPLAGDHSIALVRLDDGRTFRASSSHPLIDNTLVGALVLGALVDGARVTAIETLPYRGATWDLLPAGETGTYWADSVRLGSTLRAVSH